MGYGMLFGETTKDFFLKQIKGRGYVEVGTSDISEFYTPLVPKGHDFLKEIKKLIDSRQGVQAACEAKAAEDVYKRQAAISLFGIDTSHKYEPSACSSFLGVFK